MNYEWIELDNYLDVISKEITSDVKHVIVTLGVKDAFKGNEDSLYHNKNRLVEILEFCRENKEFIKNKIKGFVNRNFHVFEKALTKNSKPVEDWSVQMDFDIDPISLEPLYHQFHAVSVDL